MYRKFREIVNRNHFWFDRKLYWTTFDIFTFEGQVWRMNFDGSAKELVFDRMNFPRGITVDYKRKNKKFSSQSILLLAANLSN